MLAKLPFSDQRIINCLNTYYRIEVATFVFLPLGADINSSVYKVETTNQISYFVKLKRGHHHTIGATVLDFLHEAKIHEIIPPVKTTSGESTQVIDDFTLIVYPFVEGQNGFTHSLTDEQWLILGKTLKQIHEIEIPSSIQHQIRREDYSSKWRDAVVSLYASVDIKSLHDEIAVNLWKLMSENASIIHRLINRADQLAQDLKNQSAKFVLCHSDIHGGNVLLNDDNAIFIVDWDEPIMAPKERDLMFIGGGVANVWNKQHEEKSFYKGYGNCEINKMILTYYRYERIVEDIAQYGRDLLLTVTGGENRALMYQHFLDMFKSNGVVDIAFKTDGKSL